MHFSKPRNKGECRCFRVKFRKATLKVQVLMEPPENLSKQLETLILVSLKQWKCSNPSFLSIWEGPGEWKQRMTEILRAYLGVKFKVSSSVTLEKLLNLPYFCFVWGKFLLCSSSRPGTHYKAQAALKFKASLLPHFPSAEITKPGWNCSAFQRVHSSNTSAACQMC